MTDLTRRLFLHTQMLIRCYRAETVTCFRIRTALGDWEFSPSAADQLGTEPIQPALPTALASATLAAVPMHDAPITPQPIVPPMPAPTRAQPAGAAASVVLPSPTQPIATASGNPPTGIKFAVGTTIGAFQQRELQFSAGNTELNQLNIGIVGDLGTGKTQLIQSLLYQLRSNPESNRGVRPKVLIFDYKKDYSKRQFVEATGARVVNPFAIPLNIFDTRDSVSHQNLMAGAQ